MTSARAARMMAELLMDDGMLYSANGPWKSTYAVAVPQLSSGAVSEADVGRLKSPLNARTIPERVGRPGSAKE